MSTGLVLRPSCPGMARRLGLCVHISELADLLRECRKGRYSLGFYMSARRAMTGLVSELLAASERMPLA